MPDQTTWPPNNPEILGAVERLFAGGNWWVYKGPVVRAFEDRFAEWNGRAYGVSVNSGMVTTEVALRALGIGPGDRVAIPAFNYYSVTKSVLNVGAEPFFVDVSQESPTIDPEGVRQAVRAGVRAVIAVHLGGAVAPVDQLDELCEEAGVPLLEDCAQAHGASLHGRRVGSWGVAGLFSFGGVKLITCGQGGMVITGDHEFYERCFALANRGRGPDGGLNRHGIIGDNLELSDLAAATLGPQLDLLEELGRQREDRMRFLDRAIQEIPGCRPIPQWPGVGRRAQMRYCFLYSPEMHAPSRAELLSEADRAGIPLGTGPAAVSADPLLFQQFSTAHCPNARYFQDQLLSFHHPLLLRDESYWQGVLGTLRSMFMRSPRNPTLPTERAS